MEKSTARLAVPEDALLTNPKVRLKDQEFKSPGKFNDDPRRLQCFSANIMDRRHSKGAKLILCVAPLDSTQFIVEQIQARVKQLKEKRTGVYDRMENACSHQLLQLFSSKTAVQGLLPMQAITRVAELMNEDPALRDKIANVFYSFLKNPLELGQE